MKKFDNQTDNRLPENAPGSWYVTDECIICGLCDDLAPAIFRPLGDFSFNIVHHQPETNEERSLAGEAADCCPAGAIKEESKHQAN